MISRTGQIFKEKEQILYHIILFFNLLLQKNNVLEKDLHQKSQNESIML